MNEFLRGTRGEMTSVNKRAVRKENITHMNTELTQHLAYIDQNNLYGSNLCKSLPHPELCSVEDLSPFTRDFILNLDEKGKWDTLSKMSSTTHVTFTTKQHIFH